MIQSNSLIRNSLESSSICIIFVYNIERWTRAIWTQHCHWTQHCQFSKKQSMESLTTKQSNMVCADIGHN